MDPFKQIIALAEAGRVCVEMSVAATGINVRVSCVRGSPIVTRETHTWVDRNEANPTALVEAAIQRVQ
jgi:hypothetical protein